MMWLHAVIMETLSNQDAHYRNLDENSESTKGSLQNGIHCTLFFGMNMGCCKFPFTIKNAKKTEQTDRRRKEKSWKKC